MLQPSTVGVGAGCSQSVRYKHGTKVRLVRCNNTRPDLGRTGQHSPVTHHPAHYLSVSVRSNILTECNARLRVYLVWSVVKSGLQCTVYLWPMLSVGQQECPGSDAACILSRLFPCSHVPRFHFHYHNQIPCFILISRQT